MKLRMSRNTLTSINAGAFEGLINLRYLDLSYNNFQAFDFGAHFFENEKSCNHSSMPFSLIRLQLHSVYTFWANIKEDESSTAKCCFRNQVVVDAGRTRLFRDRSELDMLVERGLIKLRLSNY
jgi:hypothetical protein